MLLALAVPFVLAGGFAEPSYEGPRSDGGADLVVGDARVTIDTDIAAVERAALVSYRFRAFPLEPGAAGDVVVGVCADNACRLHRDVRVPLDGTVVMASLPVWPGGLFVRVRRGDDERIAGVGNNLSNSRVVATPHPIDTWSAVTKRAYAQSLRVVDAAETALSNAELLRGFGALVVADDTPLDDAARARIDAFVRQGGIASVPAAAWSPAPAAHDVAGTHPLVVLGVEQAVAVPVGTRALHVERGSFVFRPFGATRFEELAGLLAAEPSFEDAPDVFDAHSQVAVGAAEAQLAVRPPRPVAYSLAVACILATAACVHVGKRRGWRFALAAALAINVAGAASLWALEAVTTPRVLRTRVVTWVGPNAAIEVGVDAVRVRDSDVVRVISPVPVVSFLVLGDDNDPPRSIVLDAQGQGGTARVSGGAALAAIWQRPAERVAAVRFEGQTIVNDLDVAVRVLLDELDGNWSAFDVPAHARADGSAERMRAPSWQPLAGLGFHGGEVRVAAGLLQPCLARVAVEGKGRAPCAAAVTTLPDGTLLGVEVTQ